LPAKASNGLADGRADPQRRLLNHLPKNIYNLFIYICRKSIIREFLSIVGDPDPDLGLLDPDPLVKDTDPDPSLFSQRY
jgi:hypothetical protein